MPVSGSNLARGFSVDHVWRLNRFPLPGGFGVPVLSAQPPVVCRGKESSVRSPACVPLGAHGVTGHGSGPKRELAKGAVNCRR